MEIIGREAERARIGAWLDRVPGGAGVMLLEGEAGIGKSTVLAAALADARARDLRVLATKPTQAEQSMSFAGLADLFEPLLDEVVDDLPAVQRAALEHALLRGDDGAPPDHRTAGAATLSALRALGARRPLLLAIDDVQWLDAASARALSFALRRLDGDRVGSLLARRASPGRSAPPLGVTAPTEVAVGPLALREIGALLEQRLGWQPGHALLGRIADVSGGNPLFALELARALRDVPAPATGEQLPVPERLRDLVLARLRRLPPTHREVLLFAAATRAPTTSLVVAATDERALDALDDAEAAGLIERHGERIAFAHPLYASVLYGASRTSRRRAVHTTLAALITDPEESARHRAASALGPDEEIAGALEDAAGRARARGAVEAAAELAEAAVRLTPSEQRDARWRRQLLAAQHHLDILDSVAATRLLRDLDDDVVPVEIRAEAAWMLGRIELRTRPDDVVERVRGTLGMLGPGPSDLHARLLYQLCVATVNAANSDEAIEHGERAMRMAAELGERTSEAMALLYTLQARLMAGHGLDRELLEQTPTIESGMRSPYWRGAFLSWVGDHDAAIAWQEAVILRLDVIGDQFERVITDVFRADALFRRGDWDNAASAASTAIEVLLMADQIPVASIGVPAAAVPRAAAGDLTGARALVRRVRADGTSDRFLPSRIYLGWASGLIELTADEPAAAVEELEGALAIAEAGGYREHGVAAFRPDLVEALVRCGSLDRAADVLTTFEARAPYANEPWAAICALRCRELLAGAHGDLDAALVAGSDAVARLGRLPMPFEVARTLLVHGATLRRAKQKRAAREALERARRIFEQLGATFWAARADDEMARIGGARPEKSTDLSPTEQRIATLVAEGLTNQQIADALSVAVRTVESSLTRIYRKVGVRRRAELIRHLREGQG